MTGAALRSFVARSRSVVESSLPTDRSSTRAWLVDPFLETLGWNVHGESCTTDTTIDGTAVEYVLAVDGVPALLVAVEPAATALEKSRAVSLLETMTWCGIDRALYTNGREFLLLAGTGPVDRLSCDLDSLVDHEASIEHFTRSAIGRRTDPTARSAVARRLALERRSVVDAIVAELDAATAQHGSADELEAAATRFVDQLIVSFGGEDDGGGRAAPAGPGEPDDVSFQFTETAVGSDEDTTVIGREDEGAREQHDHGKGTDRNVRDDPRARREEVTDPASRNRSGEPEGDAAAGDAATGSGGSDTGDSNGGDDSDDNKNNTYVVRFFNDRGSIGAIGHSSSQRALVQATEYLFKRGLGGVAVPWQPTDAGRTVLNDEPVTADGTPMDAPQQLSNGLYLETAGTVDERAARVEALTERAGLRAMLTEDWK